MKITGFLRSSDKHENWLLLNVFFIFFPCFFCVASIGVTAAAILLHRHMRGRLAVFPHSLWLIIWGVLTLAAELATRNLWGLLFSLYFFSLLVFTAYYQSVMTEALCKKALRITTVLGILDLGISTFEKLLTQSRVSATFFNANYYGFICEWLIIAGIYAVFQDKPWRLAHLASVAANIGGIFLSGSYFALLAALIGLLVLLFCLKKNRIAFLLLGIAALYGGTAWFFPKIIPTTHDVSQNITYRLLIWEKAFHYFIRHPIFGNGMLTFFSISQGMNRSFRAHAHNLILDVLLNYGIVGTALLAVFLICWITLLIRNKRAHASCSLCLGVCAAAAVHGVIDVPIIGFQSAALFFLLMSLAVILPTSKKISRIYI